MGDVIMVVHDFVVYKFYLNYLVKIHAELDNAACGPFSRGIDSSRARVASI